MKGKKQALLTSGLCLGLSAALLTGATFAWFTDSVTNQGNTIQAGELKVGLQYRGLAGGAYEDVPAQATETGKLFTSEDWEPGRSQGVDLKVTNEGTLALKWQLYFTDATKGQEDEADIADVLDVYIIDANAGAEALTADKKVGTLTQVMANKGFITGDVLTGEKEFDEFSVVLKMQEGAGNRYQDCSVTFDVELRATQTASEEDGFGNPFYDSNADGSPEQGWDNVISGSVSGNVVETGDTVLTLSGATVVVPDGAVNDGMSELTLTITPTTKHENVEVSNTQDVISYEINVTGLKTDNSESITVSLPVGKDLAGVVVYHEGEVIHGATYNDSNGVVTFTTTSLGAFDVVYSLFGGGSGTQAAPYLITNSEQLNQIRMDLDAHYKLMADIDLTGWDWIPIGNNVTESENFTGSVDGNQHEIRGLNVSSIAVAQWVDYGYKNTYNYAGLFGVIGAGASVHDIIFNDCTVTATDASNSRRGDVYAGVLAGANFGNVSNVTVKTSEVHATAWLICSAGGVVGSNVGTVASCHANEVDVVAHSDGWTPNAGGIVGASGDRLYWDQHASVTDCQVLDSNISASVDGSVAVSEIDYPSSTTYFGRVYCGGIGGLSVNTAASGNHVFSTDRTATSYASGDHIIYSNELWGYGANA